MKAIWFGLSGILALACVIFLVRGIGALGRAASSAGAEAQGSGFGVILFAVILGALAWKAFARARA
jgi:hypothetical protein